MTFLAAVVAQVLKWGITILVSTIAAGISIYIVRKRKTAETQKEILAVKQAILNAKTREEMENAARENARLNGPS